MSRVRIAAEISGELYDRVVARAAAERLTLDTVVSRLLDEWAVQPSAPAYDTYVVQAGDTLRGIARRVYGDAAKYTVIARYNGIADARDIFPGQLLRIPLAGLTPAPAPIAPPAATPLPTPALTPPPMTFTPSPHYNNRPDPDDVSGIVVHSTANSTLSGVVSWFQNPQAYVSAHYIVGKDGRIVQMVYDHHRAWHAGRSEWQGRPDLNSWTLGIEMVNLNDGIDPYPQVQYQAVLALCRYLMGSYDISVDNVVGHYQVAVPAGRKTDPRGFDLDLLRREVVA